MEAERVGEEAGNASQGAESAGHPLMQYVPTRFQSFDEWLERWEAVTNTDEKLGLLHGLMDKRWWDERLISFLLEIADGYRNELLFQCGADVLGSVEPHSELNVADRQKIAKKAFSILCSKFFGEDDWWWIFNSDGGELFEKVLWFLGPARGNCHDLHHPDNLTHQQEVFRTFLLEFARLGWDFERYSVGEIVRECLVSARPQFIDILNELGELGWLSGKDVDLDIPSLRRLVELALFSRKLFFPPSQIRGGNDYRFPENLEEAVLGGSVAAKILSLYKAKEGARKRIRDRYEESARVAEAEHRRLELEELKKAQATLAERAAQLQTGEPVES